MKAPKCRLCESEHWSNQPHVWGEPDKETQVADRAPRPAVVHTPVGSSHGRYADAEKRKAYRREWMKRKRAGGISTSADQEKGTPG